MPYITLAEMQKRFGTEIDQLIDRNNDGTADTGVFEAAASDSDAQINGYVGSRYTLPFTTVPALLRELGADITRYELWDKRAPDEVRRRYEDAIARLKDIAKGLIVLSDGAEPLASNGGSFAYTSRTRQFTDSTLGGFVDGYPQRVPSQGF